MTRPESKGVDMTDQMLEFPMTKWSNLSSRRSGGNLLSFLAQMLEMHLPQMAGRSARMENACLTLGRMLHLKPEQLYSLSLAAKFHDIGMLGIPGDMLLKQDPLTPDEQTRIDQHTNLGGRLVAIGFPEFPDAAEGIWFHHERPDGAGPHGLKGSEIPIIAATVALMAGVEAMINGRPGQKTLGMKGIIKEITEGINLHFDPKVSLACLSMAPTIYNVLRATSPQPEEETPTPEAAEANPVG
jgi:response regulator RpfG family c-di-GMP phosphodiesterase